MGKVRRLLGWPVGSPVRRSAGNPDFERRYLDEYPELGKEQTTAGKVAKKPFQRAIGRRNRTDGC